MEETEKSLLDYLDILRRRKLYYYRFPAVAGN